MSTQEDNVELLALSREIKSQIHADYYLADLLTKGVAYHIGYLPSDIRLRIEDLFKNGAIKTIFCTSTLIEGVNLPADNLFITSYKNGLSHVTPVEFRNLVGRVGRIEFNLYGNVFLTRIEDGTTNPLTIFLQRNGFSREASTYIKQHLEYITEVNGEYKVKTELLDCPSKSVCKEAAEIKYNIPELFIEA